MKKLRQFAGRDIVHAVERAVGGVDCAVQIERGRLLTQKERGGVEPGGLFLRLHQHVHRCVDCDHFIAAARHFAGQRTCTAAQIEQKAEFTAVTVKLRFIIVCKFRVWHVPGEPVVPCGERAVAAHLSSPFFMRSNTMA